MTASDLRDNTGHDQTKTFRSWQPGQTHLKPPSPIEWLPSDHLVFFLLDLPNALDFSAIMSPALAKDPRGEKGFAPRIEAQPSAQRLTLLLYAYYLGIVSSRLPGRRPACRRHEIERA